MDRQQALAILSTMDDDYLMRALSAVGIEGGGMQGEHNPMADMENSLEPWDLRRVAIAPPNKPQFLDSSKFVQPPQQMMAKPAFVDMGQDMEGLEEFVAGNANMTMGA